MPLLQPQSHFFLQDKNFTQTKAQSFGAKSENVFNITSTCKTNAAKKVYAICKGTILLQPQTGSTNKVNVILKPFNQPISNIPIKYIIYRGLNKADFITGKNVNATGTGFVDYIQEEFKAFYKNAKDDDAPDEAPPPFLAKYMGYPEKVSDQNANQLIDHLFYKIATTKTNGDEKPETAYELPTIPRGTQLGTVNGEIGIDIILNKGDYYTESDADLFQLNLAYARAATGTIKLSGNNFFKKRQREMATQFIDVAAFYGLHANGAGKVYQAAKATALTKTDDIYKLLNGFSSKNTTYIYIQANRQRSYNFYNNYTTASDNANNIKIGKPGDATTETTFGNYGWPIHQYEPTITASKPAAFALQLITDNYPDAALYVHTGTLLSQHEENFVRNTNLLQQNTETNPVYTKPIEFAISASNKKPIAAFINILYEGKQMTVEQTAENEELNTEDLILKDIDDVFGLLDAKPVNRPQNEQQLPTIVDDQFQIINFPIETGNKDIGIIKHQIIEDRIETYEEDEYLGRFTYETSIVNMKRKTSIPSKTKSANFDSSKTNNQNLNGHYQIQSPYYLRIKSFYHYTKSIKGLTIQTSDFGKPSKKILGLTKAELQRLKASILDEKTYNHKLYFNHIKYNGSEVLIASQNVTYKVFEILIIAEDVEGNLKIIRPNNENENTEYVPIEVYTIDELFIFSKDYSEFEKDNFIRYSYIKLEV